MRQCFAKYTMLILISMTSVVDVYSVQSESQSKKTVLPDQLIARATRLVNVATNHDTVSFLLNQADQLLQDAPNPHLTISVLNLRGLNEFYCGNYEAAIDYYYQTQNRAEQVNDSLLMAKANHNLGMIFDELEDYREAISYFQKSLQISQQLKDTALIAKTYQNLAIAHQSQKDLPKALEYNEKANQLATLRKDTLMMIDVINNFGTVAYDQKKLDESMEYYRKALDLYQKKRDRKGMALAYNNIGLVYLDKKEYTNSLEYFKKSLALATELKMYDFTGDIYSNLTVYYAERKDYKNAYFYYDRFNVVYDSLVGEKKNKVIRQIQAKYQLQKNNRELEELKNKSQSQLDAIDSAKSIQVYLVAITILVVALMIATFYLLFKEKKLAIELKSKAQELRELNHSKDKFFSIIAHDLKNPFNVLVSYTSILKTDLEMFSKDELKQIIDDLNQASENGYNLLQNLLLWTRSQTNRIHIYKTNFNLAEVFEDVKAIVEFNLIEKEQQLAVETNDELIAFADKDMITTVLRNLIFNAIKFSSKGSEIKVKTSVVENQIQVDVIDSGVGIPTELIEKLFVVDQNTTTSGTEGEIGTGLGLVICREFVEKNGGTIRVESQPGKGSAFSFTIPLGKQKIA